MGRAIQIAVGILFWPLGVWWLTGAAKAKNPLGWGTAKRLMVSAAALIAGFVFIGAIVPSRPKAAPTQAPTATSAPQATGRLGETRDQWIAAKGPPTKGVVGDLFGNTEAAFAADGRAWHIELLLAPAQSVQAARSAAKPLLPADSVPIRTYTAPAGQTVEVFRSASLAATLSAASFEGEEPGTFIQIAERASAPTTGRVVIGLGNNP